MLIRYAQLCYLLHVKVFKAADNHGDLPSKVYVLYSKAGSVKNYDFDGSFTVALGACIPKMAKNRGRAFDGQTVKLRIDNAERNHSELAEFPVIEGSKIGRAHV